MTVRPWTGDPLQRAENRWRERYRACFTAVRDAALPEPDAESPPMYRELRLAAERFALDQACEGGCRALRWICSADAPSDDTQLDSDYAYLVDRIRLALLLDCLIAVGRCDCASCDQCAAVPLARVRVGPGARDDCPCRVIAVDDAPPYRRLLGHDCPPAALGHVNLGDLIGQRPEGVCLEVTRRGLLVVEEEELSAADALGSLSPKLPPIFACHDAIRMLTVDDECLHPRVVGFQRVSIKRVPDAPAVQAVSDQPLPDTGRPPHAHRLLRIDGMNGSRIEQLAKDGVTTFEGVADASYEVLRRAFKRWSEERLEKIRAQAREFAAGETSADESDG